MKKLKRLLSARIYIRKIGVPVWATVLALMMIAGTAAQAAGPLLTGNITGNVGAVVAGGGGVTVSGSIVLATGTTAKNTIVDAADFTMAVSDDGTAFTSAIETFENKPVKIELDIDNKSGAEAFAFVTILAPADFSLDAEEITTGTAADTHGISVARFNATTWLMKVPKLEAAADRDLNITITGTPGFHSVRIVIRQMTPPG